ncbi:MAG: hypothetical protein SGJ23_04015 [Alphaproteobacteria bacterium]|nr:hypothetical protein [Alphaproteobacteria bacterium]
MKFVCDAPGGKTWFRIETEAEADAESEIMRHAVAKYFRRERERVIAAWAPPASAPPLERDIGLKDYVARSMPKFLTLRDDEGTGLATAMLAPDVQIEGEPFRTIIVGPANSDPYEAHAESIAALARHLGEDLARGDCYPYS